MFSCLDPKQKEPTLNRALHVSGLQIKKSNFK